MKIYPTQRHFHLKHNANLRLFLNCQFILKHETFTHFLLLMKNAPKTEEKSQQRVELRLLASE